jgi:hypothetical protein
VRFFLGKIYKIECRQRDLHHGKEKVILSMRTGTQKTSTFKTVACVVNTRIDDNPPIETGASDAPLVGGLDGRCNKPQVGYDSKNIQPH